MPDLIGRVAEFCTQRSDTVSRTEGDPAERATRTAPRQPPTEGTPESESTGRRRFLAAAGAGAATLLAGCSDALPGGNETVNVTVPPTDTPTATDAPTATAGSSGSGSDAGTATPVPEVDVAGLVTNQDGSDYEFIVTLDAAGGTGGADRWQVETLDGSELGRKEFSSPRKSSQFTSSKTVAVGDATAVVVRGHGVDTGYGGQVMLADLEEGLINVEKQGAERKSFEGYSF